jgi:general secretion pathway protein N
VLPANPLWAVRLGELPATRDRPIFSPSRRPRAPPPVLLAAPPPPPKPAAPREPDRPPLALLGTIVSPSLQIAIFREEATSETRRLKTGDDYKGWALRSVTSREARFEGRNQTAVLALPPPEAAAVNSALVGESDLPARHRKR